MRCHLRFSRLRDEYTTIDILTRLEVSLWRVDSRFEIDLMNRTFAADFFEFGRSGRHWSRNEALHADRQPIDAVLPLPDLQVRLLNEETALVTYNSAVTYDGVIEYSRRSSIWTKQATEWGLRFHQGTPYIP
jgi:hypothetical protein